MSHIKLISLAILYSWVSWGAIVRVQSAEEREAWVSMISTPTVGNLVVVTFSSYYGPGQTCTGVSDNQGNTYTQAYLNGQGDINVQGMYYTIVATASGTFTISVACTDLQFATIAAEYSGMAASGVLDQISTHASGFSSAPLSNAVTTTQDEILLVGHYTGGRETTMTPAAGYTVVQTQNREVGQAFLDQIVAVTGTYTVSATLLGDEGWNFRLAAFKGAGGGGGGPSDQRRIIIGALRKTK